MATPAFRWIGALAVAALALGGCNSGSSTSGNFPTNVQPSGTPTASQAAGISASQLLAASLNDISTATSYRVQATNKVKKLTTKIDMRYTKTGSQGTVTIDTTVVDLIRVGPDTYVKAPDAFWQTQLSSAQYTALIPKIHNMWVKVATLGSTFGQLSAVTDKQQVITQLVKKDTTHFLRGSEKTVDNVAAITLTDPSDGSIIYVAATGRPYPVEAVGATGTSKVSHFSEWNVAFSVSAPPASQTYTLPSS